MGPPQQFSFCCVFFVISLTVWPMGLISPRFSPNVANFYRDASSALLQLTRQPIIMVESYLLTFSRFPLPKTKKNPALTRIELTTSALEDVQVIYYNIIDHSGDEGINSTVQQGNNERLHDELIPGHN